jgi:hypothetical protein
MAIHRRSRPRSRVIAGLCVMVALALASQSALAATIDLPAEDMVASAHTRGQYDNFGLVTWNGQPLSETNQPTLEENQLSADWNYYVDPDVPNELFIEATNIRDTTWAIVFGLPFELVALTRVEFSFDTVDGSTLPTPEFSNAWARPGQALDGRPNFSDPPVSIPLETTPGWDFDVLPEGTSSIGTSDVGYALSHFTGVYGTTRIVGGAIFQLVYPPGTDLRSVVDFRTLRVTAFHGLGDRYEAPGTLTFAIEPEATPLPLAVDVKPGSDRNPVNLRSKQVSVAVLGTETLPVTALDVGSLTVGGASTLRTTMTDINGDGRVDLLLKGAIRSMNLTTASNQICVAGRTALGREVLGCDNIRIVPR